MSSDKEKGMTMDNVEGQDEGSSSSAGTGNRPSWRRLDLNLQIPEREEGLGSSNLSNFQAMSLAERSQVPRPQEDQRQITNQRIPSSSSRKLVVGLPYPKPSNAPFFEPIKESSGGDTPAQNHLGYPIRPGMNDCGYYVRTGTCPYAEKCRNNHPDVPTPFDPPSPAVPRSLAADVIELTDEEKRKLKDSWAALCAPQPVNPANKQINTQLSQMQHPAEPVNSANEQINIQQPHMQHHAEPVDLANDQIIIQQPHMQHHANPVYPANEQINIQQPDFQHPAESINPTDRQMIIWQPHIQHPAEPLNSVDQQTIIQQPHEQHPGYYNQPWPLPGDSIVANPYQGSRQTFTPTRNGPPYTHTYYATHHTPYYYNDMYNAYSHQYLIDVYDVYEQYSLFNFPGHQHARPPHGPRNRTQYLGRFFSSDAWHDGSSGE